MPSTKEMKNQDEASNAVPSNFKLEALGGLAAGIIGTIIGYPLDLVKTRMQTAKAVSVDGVSVHTESMLQLGARIVRTEGIPALYKGMTPPLISLSILNTMNFTSYNYFRSHAFLQAKRGWDINNGLAGMMGGPLGSTISTVEHMVKTQMQLDNISERRYRNSIHCVTSLVKERGWRVLYTGHMVNTSREGLFLATYFYTYEGMRVSLGDMFRFVMTTKAIWGDQKDNYNCVENVKAPGWTVPLAGGISGAWAWFITFPLDSIKAGIQGQPLSQLHCTKSSSLQPGGKKVKSLEVFKYLMQTKGWKGLYSGVTPSITRAFLVSSTRFSAYEFVIWLGGDYFR